MQNDMKSVEVIARMVDALLPRFSGENKILIMGLEFINHEKENDQGAAASSLTLGFHRPRNYMKVFCGEGYPMLALKKSFDVYCDHDSVWRDDGVRSIIRIFKSKHQGSPVIVSFCSSCPIQLIQTEVLEYKTRKGKELGSICFGDMKAISW